MSDILFRPKPTGRRFLRSQAFVRILMGPRGTGKTTLGYLDDLVAVHDLPAEVLPLRVAVVRDTWTNLARTTLETLRELERKGIEVEWRDGDHEALVEGRVQYLFMGMDSAKDWNKFQGLGVGRLWLEEPAPATELSGGIDQVVLGLGTTALRQAGVPRGVRITMNPPDEDHWVLGLAQHRDFRGKVEMFEIPPSESYMTAEQQQEFEGALRAVGKEDLAQRLVHGKIGFAPAGEAVCPEFNPKIHVAPEPLEARPAWPVQRLLDFGLNPTVIWTQRTPQGFWNILGAVRGENIGLLQAIEHLVKPWELQFLGDPLRFRFRDIGDPAGLIREQSNSERSAVSTWIAAMGPGAGFEPGPVEWAERRGAVKSVLAAPLILGRGRLQIDPDPDGLGGGQLVARALRRCQYKRDALGRVVDSVESMKAASGLHHHVFDALSYGAARLFPVEQYIRVIREPMRPPRSPGALGWMAR